MINIISRIILITFLAIPWSAHAQTSADILQLGAIIPSTLRQGDHFEFTATLSNQSDSELTGQIQLELLDAITNEPVDGWFQNVFPNQFFTIASGTTATVKFPIEIPYQFTNVLKWKLVASSGSVRNEKHGILSILSDQFFQVDRASFNEKTSRLQLNHLSSSETNETILNKSLSFEIYNNTAWPLFRLIPVLAYSDGEPLDYWNRWSAFNYAKKMINLFGVGNSFTRSVSADSSGLKQEEIFRPLTPWVWYTVNEKWQKEITSTFFDTANINRGLEASLQQLIAAQLPDGSFPWMKGGHGNTAVTSYIISGIKKLKQPGITDKKQNEQLETILEKAISYTNSRRKTGTNPAFSIQLNDSVLFFIQHATGNHTPLPAIKISSGDVSIDPSQHPDFTKGYSRKSFEGAFVKPSMAKINIIKGAGSVSAFTGMVEWSYFSPEKKLPAGLPFQLSKKLFVEKETGNKHILVPVSEETVLHIGDRVKVMINIHLTKPVKSFSLRDQYPSALEPVTRGMFVKRNNISWYEKKLPGARTYFFPALPAGDHSFSYWSIASYPGDFSGGITTAGYAFEPEKFIFKKGYILHVEQQP
jgi:hypothetical protein